MGPWLLIGTHALGGCVLLFDGAPDFPDPAGSGGSSSATG